jgi:NADP-dependent 3-hydroxy acid dehydrogenase YdfG
MIDGDASRDWSNLPLERRPSLAADRDDGRVAVITGGSSGIGAATARRLAADGFRVVLLARRADRIQALAGELGQRALAIRADVTDRDSLVAAAERVQQEFGRAEILINNAAAMGRGPFTSEQRGLYRQMVETNLLGAMTTTEVFLPQLRAGGGDLVNISSVASRSVRAGIAVYAATKFGLNGWSEVLRQELQPDVRVIVIEPGGVATEPEDELFEPYPLLPVDQVAEIISFCVSRPRTVSINEVLVRPTGQPH